MRFCTQCGAMNADNNAVCAGCGAPLYPNAAQPVAPQAQAVPAPAYVPPGGVPPQGGYPVPAVQTHPPASPASPGYAAPPWPSAAPLALKKKGRLWVWLGPVLGVVVLGGAALVLWLTGVLDGLLGGVPGAASVPPAPSVSRPAAPSRPSGGASSSAPASGAPGASSGPEVLSDNPFIAALQQYARGRGDVYFISGVAIDDFGELARDALDYRENGVETVSYVHTAAVDLVPSIELAIGEYADVIILVNAGQGYPEVEAMAADAGVEIYYIEVDVLVNGAAAGEATGEAQAPEDNPFFEPIQDQLEQSSVGAALVGLVDEAAMADAEQAVEYFESQGYRVENLLNTEVAEMQPKVLTMLAAGEVDVVVMVNIDYQTLILEMMDAGYEIVYMSL